MGDKQHAKEVEAAAKAWNLSVSKSEGLHVTMGNIIRAVDLVRAKERARDWDETNRS